MRVNKIKRNKKKKFKILATDGKKIWELFFITQSKKGDFYLGSITPGIPYKISRHVSGEMHFKLENLKIYEKLDKRQKLEEFEGLEQLLCFGVSKKAFENGLFKPYKGRKFDGSAIIDIRNYKKGFNVMPFLISSDKISTLKSLAQSFPDCQIIIFTQPTPWIVLLIHGW